MEDSVSAVRMGPWSVYRLDGRDARPPLTCALELLPVEALFDRDLAVLLHVDDAMHALESRQSNVDYVGARIQVQVDRRELIENAIVDGNLRSLGLRLDADCTHSRNVAAPEELLELAANLDVVGVAQNSQARRQTEDLPNLKIRGRGLFKVALLLE